MEDRVDEIVKGVTGLAERFLDTEVDTGIADMDTDVGTEGEEYDEIQSFMAIAQQSALNSQLAVTQMLKPAHKDKLVTLFGEQAEELLKQVEGCLKEIATLFSGEEPEEEPDEEEEEEEPTEEPEETEPEKEEPEESKKSKANLTEKKDLLWYEETPVTEKGIADLITDIEQQLEPDELGEFEMEYGIQSTRHLEHDLKRNLKRLKSLKKE
jgi:hypothetical protein